MTYSPSTVSAGAELCRGLQIDEEKAFQHAAFYNANYAAYGNEVYSRVETRLTHWLNYLEGGWFQRRFEMALPHARANQTIVDLGFSVPYWYMQPEFQEQDAPRFVFVEKEESATHFYSTLIARHSWQHLASRDQILAVDLDTHIGQEAVLSVTERATQPLLFVASEVIEHLYDPTGTWNMLRRATQINKAVRIYVTIPIGQRIPSHTLEFRDEHSAQAYVENEMVITESATLRPSSDEFSEFLTGCFCAYGHMRI